MIAIIDYGMGNLKSVQNALEYIGSRATITSDRAAIRAADAVVLPGVGAFGEGMKRLEKQGLDIEVKDAIAAGKPFLGICLGLQLLLQSSEEGAAEGEAPVPGLGIFPGRVVRFRPAAAEELKVPHMGWSKLDRREDAPLFAGLSGDIFVYFVHSYHAQLSDRAPVTATCDYGIRFDAAVSTGNVHAMQFHPEKSGDVGLTMLRNFVRTIKC